MEKKQLLSFNKASRLMKGVTFCKIANNTYLKKYRRRIELIYHNTTIVKMYKNRLVLDNGSFYTPTTKTRMNWVLNSYGLHLRQKGGIWYVENKKSKEEHRFNNNMSIIGKNKVIKY